VGVVRDAIKEGVHEERIIKETHPLIDMAAARHAVEALPVLFWVAFLFEFGPR